MAGRTPPEASGDTADACAACGAENAPASFLGGSGGLQRVSATLTRMSLRFDLAWHRRPRLFETLLSIAGVPALCLFGAGANIDRVGQGTGFGDLLMTTMPLALLTLTVGSRRCRLAAELEPRQIAALRSILVSEAWQIVSREVQANTTRCFAGPATLDQVLFWIAGPRLSDTHGRSVTSKAAQAEALGR